MIIIINLSGLTYQEDPGDIVLQPSRCHAPKKCLAHTEYFDPINKGKTNTQELRYIVFRYLFYEMSPLQI